MEGRDIGTVVFPRAEVKIFLDASAEIRGQRRYEQMGARGTMSLDEVICDLRERDERDRNRLDSPLKPAEDSIVLDSSALTLDQTVQAALDIVGQVLRRTR